MKKYIRRTNGVYEIKIDKKLKERNVVNYFYITDNENKNHNILFDKESLKRFKQADTIEELCDELYFVEDETNIPRIVNRLRDFDKDKKLTECCLEIGGWITWLKNYSKKGCIKGAIFTSKGIIYVAKLNDKGEFELL